MKTIVPASDTFDRRGNFILRGTKGHYYRCGHAPQGGRHVFKGPIDPTPFAFVFPSAVVIDNYGGTAREYAGAVEVDINEPVMVEGYGVHVFVKDSGHGYLYWDGVNVVILPVEKALAQYRALVAKITPEQEQYRWAQYQRTELARLEEVAARFV